MTCMSGSDGLRDALLGGAASFCSSNEFHPARTQMDILGSAKMTNDSAHSYVSLAFSTVQT